MALKIIHRWMIDQKDRNGHNHEEKGMSPSINQTNKTYIPSERS